MNPFRFISDRIFGFDVFVSYSRKDSIVYAQKLEEELNRLGLRAFLDHKEMPPGETLRTSLRGALTRSSALVMIASPGALGSIYMPVEFDNYVKARKRPRIVPISIGRTLDDGAAEIELIKRLRSQADVIWITEQPDLLTQGPSAEVLKSLVDGFKFTRRNTIRQRVISAAATVLFMLLVVATAQWFRAEAARKEAVEAQAIAETRAIARSAA